jgi:DNA polymerase IV
MNMRTIMHIDFNSFFATVEQQANPRLRGKPIGVTGGDRMKRTVIGAASVEAKKFGVKTGMRIPEALSLCPKLILVRGDSDKYLECTKRFLNILKDYSPLIEVFSIDEVFLELVEPETSRQRRASLSAGSEILHYTQDDNNMPVILSRAKNLSRMRVVQIAEEIKSRIRKVVGDWITCSVGVSYNKRMAKFAGSLYKPDGLAAILDPESAMMLLDQVELNEICGIGGRIKKRLNNMGVFSFAQLRKVPLESLLASFKSYGQILYNMARGLDDSPVVPFYEKEEVKSVGHRHTINHDTADLEEIKQITLKLTEMIGKRMRDKSLVGKTVVIYYRSAFDLDYYQQTGSKFAGEGMQATIPYTSDGLEIFKAVWRVFLKIWDQREIRMIGVSVSSLKEKTPQNLTLLEEVIRQEKIVSIMDKINDRYGDFTLQRGILLGSQKVYRKANPFLADRRFKL